jgi:hypothetical protein
MSENPGQNKMNSVPEMDEFREMAADIIDEMIEAIQQEYPDLKPKLGILEESSNAAILYGESYYNLESSIEDQLREKFSLKMLGQTSTEAD